MADSRWNRIRRSIRDGHKPQLRTLLAAMSEEGVPEDLGEYVAARFAPPKRGRPQLTQREKEWRFRWLSAVHQLVERVRFWADVPKEEAIRRVADYLCVADETVRGYLNQFRRERKGSGFMARLAEDPKTLPRRPPDGG